MRSKRAKEIHRAARASGLTHAQERRVKKVWNMLRFSERGKPNTVAELALMARRWRGTTATSGKGHE